MHASVSIGASNATPPIYLSEKPLKNSSAATYRASRRSTMPLMFSASPEVDANHLNGVRFPMKDGDDTVFVTVSRLALDRRAT
jgi:hypothetical protein